MTWKAEVEHVVVLMLENQSFDRLLGFVRLDDPAQRLDGVTGDEAIPAIPGDPTRRVRVRRATEPGAYVTDPTPGHQLEDITMQVFGAERVPDPPTPTMNGFVWRHQHAAPLRERRVPPPRDVRRGRPGRHPSQLCVPGAALHGRAG